MIRTRRTACMNRIHEKFRPVLFLKANSLAGDGDGVEEKGGQYIFKFLTNSSSRVLIA